MEAVVHKTVGITLRLNENEARWLKNYTQNFIGSQDTTEGKKASAMREDLFCVLREGLGD